MSISYPLSLPSSCSPNGTSWSLLSAVGSLESPFTFQQQVQEHAGQRWMIDANFPVMKPEQAGDWRAFFAMLRGSRGTFLFGDVTRLTPLGAIKDMVGIDPRVKGASQSGDELIIDGLSNSITNAFLAGDWIQLGSGATSRLHMVVANASTNGSGETTLTIVPDLRESPADNAVVTYENCKGVFRSPKNDIDLFGTTGTNLSSFRLIGVEAL